MLITSNSSPASGELLEDDADGATLPADSVPESSHTIEIQFVSGIDVYESECTVIEEVDGCFRTCDDTDVQANFDYSEGLVDGDRPALEFEATPSSSNECSTDSHDDFGETDLTNLNWLQNITNIMPVPSLSISPKPPPKPLVQNVRLHKFKQTVLKCQEDFAENLEEYRSNDSKKPAYSYCSLICLAMRHNENKMTLSAIYSWIKENFKYYRSADPTWQNSIRHNLSLNKVFVKVARSKHEPGKGGFWKLDLARLEDSRKYKKVPSPPKPPRKQKASTPARKPARGDAGLLRDDGDSFDAFEATKRATDSISDMSGQLPDFSLDGLDLVLSDPMESDDFGPNVIVEQVPAEEELGALLLAAPWEDLQPELTDSLFDSYLK